MMHPLDPKLAELKHEREMWIARMKEQILAAYIVHHSDHIEPFMGNEREVVCTLIEQLHKRGMDLADHWEMVVKK